MVVEVQYALYLMTRMARFSLQTSAKHTTTCKFREMWKKWISALSDQLHVIRHFSEIRTNILGDFAATEKKSRKIELPVVIVTHCSLYAQNTTNTTGKQRTLEITEKVECHAICGERRQVHSQTNQSIHPLVAYRTEWTLGMTWAESTWNLCY